MNNIIQVFINVLLYILIELLKRLWKKTSNESDTKYEISSFLNDISLFVVRFKTSNIERRDIYVTQDKCTVVTLR